MSLPTSSRLQRRRTFFRRVRLYLYSSAGLLLIIGLLYLIIGSGWFKIAEIKIVGAEPQDERALLVSLKTQVAARNLAGWLGADNYLSWPTDLHYTAPTITDVRIEKAFWPKTVEVTVVPRTRFVVWCKSDTECYWVDEKGVAFKTSPITEGQLVQTIFDNAASSSPVMLGDQVIAPNAFDVIRKVIFAVREMNISVISMAIDQDLQELNIYTAAGARVGLSLRFNPNISAIPAMRRFSDKPGFSKIEYLNLTVENRAYVKYR